MAKRPPRKTPDLKRLVRSCLPIASQGLFDRIDPDDPNFVAIMVGAAASLYLDAVQRRANETDPRRAMQIAREVKQHSEELRKLAYLRVQQNSQDDVAVLPETIEVV